jgi:predicted deacylase
MTIPHTPAALFDWESIKRGEAANVMLTFECGDRAGEIPLRIVKGKEQGPTLLILAAVHGDEYDGVRTVIELIHSLQPQDIRGTLLMVPIVNMPAYEGISRVTPLDGKNLAREFPGSPEGSYTERLAYYLDQYILAKADFLLDLHSGAMEFSIPVLVGYYANEEQEIGRRSRAAAEAFGMETIWAHPQVGPGRTVSAATERGIPWLYTEASGGRRIKLAEQEQYRRGAYRLMHHLGMLLAPEAWLLQPAPAIKRRLKGDGDFDASLLASVDGFFIPAVELLQIVEEGEYVGSLYGLFGEELEKLHAPSSGIVVGLAEMPYIKKAGIVCSITGVGGITL